MNASFPSSSRRSTVVWLMLILATLISLSLGEEGAAGPGVAATLLAIACLKGRAVALEFMELRHAPSLWRWLMTGWLLLVSLLIGLAYLKGIR